jgi:hypothetical protein
MDLEGHYRQIIEQISQGHRGLKRFSMEEQEQLSEFLTRALDGRDHQQLEKVLCLIEHSSQLNPGFGPGLERSLSSELPDHLLVFALNCARKHIIEARFQRGQRLHYEFLEILKRLLHSPSPEVVEWTLRTIEECGPQGIYFRQEFDKIKPPPWKWFNAHQRAVREIIELLERRWGKFEKP